MRVAIPVAEDRGWESLRDLDGFERIWLLDWLDRRFEPKDPGEAN